VVLIDVREVPEYEDAHIAGAVLLPLSKVQSDSIPENPDKKIVFQCRSGGRSMRACQIGAPAYPDRVFYNLQGGIMDWAESGYPVQSVSS